MQVKKPKDCNTPIIIAVKIAVETEAESSLSFLPATKLVLVFISGSLYNLAILY